MPLTFLYDVFDHESAETTAKYAQERRYHRTLDDLSDFGPRPYCRYCQKEVDRWAWTKYDGFWGFTVYCHGDIIGGLTPTRALTGFLRLEVFCDDEPHHAHTWWVNKDGSPVQHAPAELINATDTGGFFNSPF